MPNLGESSGTVLDPLFHESGLMGTFGCASVCFGFFLRFDAGGRGPTFLADESKLHNIASTRHKRHVLVPPFLTYLIEFMGGAHSQHVMRVAICA